MAQRERPHAIVPRSINGTPEARSRQATVLGHPAQVPVAARACTQRAQMHAHCPLLLIHKGTRSARNGSGARVDVDVIAPNTKAPARTGAFASGIFRSLPAEQAAQSGAFGLFGFLGRALHIRVIKELLRQLRIVGFGCAVAVLLWAALGAWLLRALVGPIGAWAIAALRL